MQRKESIHKKLFLAIQEYDKAEFELKKARLDDIEEILKEHEGLANSKNKYSGENILMKYDVSERVTPELLNLFYQYGFDQSNDYLKAAFEHIESDYAFSEVEPECKERLQKYDLKNILNAVEAHEGKKINPDRLLMITDGMPNRFYLELLSRVRSTSKSQYDEYFRRYVNQTNTLDKEILKEFMNKGIDVMSYGDRLYQVALNKNAESLKAIEELGVKRPENALGLYMETTIFQNQKNNCQYPNAVESKRIKEIIEYLTKDHPINAVESEQIVSAFNKAGIPYGDMTSPFFTIRELQKHGFELDAVDTENGNNIKSYLASSVAFLSKQEISPIAYEVLRDMPQQGSVDDFFEKYKTTDTKGYVLDLRVISRLKEMDVNIDRNKVISAIIEHPVFSDIDLLCMEEQEESEITKDFRVHNKDGFSELPKDFVMSEKSIYQALRYGEEKLGLDPDDVAKHVIESVKENPELLENGKKVYVGTSQEYLENFAVKYVAFQETISPEMVELFNEHDIDIKDYQLSYSFGEFSEMLEEDEQRYKIGIDYEDIDRDDSEIGRNQ